MVWESWAGCLPATSAPTIFVRSCGPSDTYKYLVSRPERTLALLIIEHGSRTAIVIAQNYARAGAHSPDMKNTGFGRDRAYSCCMAV